MKTLKILFKAMLMTSAGIMIGHGAFALTNGVALADIANPLPASQPETARGLYNAGSQKLRAGKLGDAESLLESSLAKQDERVQPAVLFNLGHVRFAQGGEDLKKAPAGATQRSQAATETGGGAIQKATDALANNDLQQMVDAYMAGRGVNKEMRAAMTAIQRAMETYGKTLVKWRRSLGDFQGAVELNPADTNAVHNAKIVEQEIAKLIDRMQEMQQAAASLAGKQSQLKKLLGQLKGQIPAPNMPPGAPGEDGEEGDDGERPMPESLSGMKEHDDTGGGEEMEVKISPENAAALLNGLQQDGKPLPAQGEAGKPKDRSQRIW